LTRVERDRKNEETDRYVLLATTNLVNRIARIDVVNVAPPIGRL
jgi:hypothetical protein